MQGKRKGAEPDCCVRCPDYAPDDYFTAAHPVRPAYNFTETFIGAGLDNMSHDAMFAAFASVSQYATKFDASGLVVDYRVRASQ